MKNPDRWCPDCEDTVKANDDGVCPYCGGPVTEDFPPSEYETYERENPR